MAERITVYQKPTCSKCHSAVSILTERGVEFDVVDYYTDPFTPEGLAALLAKLGMGPRDLLRAGEPLSRELGLAERAVGDDELVRLMVENPDLIQRPIVVRGDRAIVARPPEI